MVKLNEVKETFVKMLSVIKNDNNRGVVKLKVTIPGNKEMFSIEIEDDIKLACSEIGFHLQSCFVFNDESWTDVKIEVIDLKYLSSYIDTLNKKLQVRDTPRMYINAMNKAIDLATGEWICFMNSGDVFYSTSILQDFSVKMSDKDVDVYYGDHEVNYEEHTKIVKANNKIEDIWKRMVFSHQSCFVKKEVLSQYKFNNC